MASITETNEQYYQGVQAFRGLGSGTLSGQKFTTTFNTDLIFFFKDGNGSLIS